MRNDKLLLVSSYRYASKGELYSRVARFFLLTLRVKLGVSRALPTKGLERRSNGGLVPS